MKQQMFTKLIQIGNSHGVRLPKSVIDQIGLTGELELEVRDGEIILRSHKHPRDGWDAAYKRMGKNGDGRLSAEDQAWLDASNTFDDDEWEW